MIGVEEFKVCHKSATAWVTVYAVDRESARIDAGLQRLSRLLKVENVEEARALSETLLAETRALATVLTVVASDLPCEFEGDVETEHRGNLCVWTCPRCGEEREDDARDE